MDAVAQETTVDSSGGGSVDQTSYIDDAFSGYLNDAKEETEEQQAQAPKTEQQAEKPKDEAVKTPEQLAEEEKNKKPDPFDTAFSGEGGLFDLDKIVGVSLDGVTFQNEERPVVAEPGQTDNKPAWEKEYEEEQTFRTNLHTSRLGPLESAWKNIDGNASIPSEVKNFVFDAINAEFVKIKDENDKFIRERSEQNSFKKQQEQAEKIKEEFRSAKLPELAKSNAMSIVNKLPGADARAKIDLYNRIVFGPDAGGEMLQDMFEARYPDFSKLPKEEQAKTKLKFVQELQADGNRLQRHFNRAYRYLIADPKNMKKIMGQVSRATDANARSNQAAAQRQPTGTVQRQPQAGSSQWDGYFANPEGSKTRI